ncbi:MAG: AfsR/SARP family transcriptional regulator [Acidimicrobiales bacterium]
MRSDGGDPGVEVEVQVLGPAEVRGAAGPFRRAWSLELVVYLAMHPRGAANEAWATALWPDRLMAAPTLHSTASAARRALGRSPAGADHLPRRHGRLVLAPTVGTDWGRFRRLAASPCPATWGRAIALVRDRPFQGLRSPDWTVLEGVVAEVEDGVVALAGRLAEHHLAAGEGQRAAQVARRALLASPYDERLYRLLLRAADRQGNPAGVEATMAELVGLVAGVGLAGTGPGGGPAGRAGPWLTGEAARCVHPDTAALYRSLSRRPAGAGSPVAARL